MRILLVEDHRFFSDAIELLLGQRLMEARPEPATFRRAATVAEGSRLARAEGPFDLAVVDLMLPDGDGTEVVREIKASSPATPVAVLSVLKDLSGALEAGADEVVHKDIPLLELIDVLVRRAQTTDY